MLVHQLCFPEGGSNHSVDDVTPATSAGIGVVLVSDAYGSNLHHAVLSETSLMGTFYCNPVVQSRSCCTHIHSLSLKPEHTEERRHVLMKVLIDTGSSSLFGTDFGILANKEHKN